MDAKNIGDILHKEYAVPLQNFRQAPVPSSMPGGSVLCRFDMMVRWPEHAKRKINPFTYRGDHYEKHDTKKMLWNLVRQFKNNRHNYLLVELRDNTKPAADETRIILRVKNGMILINRLSDYEEMLKDFPVPEWLKSSV